MINKIQKQFGKKLQTMRKEKGYSQEELAFRAGLDRTYISGIERGIRNPALKNIAKLAKALDVEVIELFKLK